MRVISGTARRTQLRTPKGDATRPTQDRIKETLFNMLSDAYVGGTFVDLFAGSGQMGIEALSRGASRAVFVERDRQACDCIRQNLAATHLEDAALLLCADVSAAVKDRRFPADAAVIFLDPPYDRGWVDRTLGQLAAAGRLSKDTLIVAETSLSEDPGLWETEGIEILRVKDYKTNRHVFCRFGPAAEETTEGQP